MAVTTAQLVEASAWLNAYVAAAERSKEAAAQAAAVAWATYEGSWYNTAATMALASQMAQASTAGQDVIAGSAQQFIANVVALLRGTRVTIPRTSLPPVRNGADLPLVHSRVAETYKRQIALGKTHEAALRLAVGRAEGIARTDLTLRERDAQQAAMRSLGITQFRRIVRPELSKTGSCGLCIAAADRIYNVAELMPIHPPSCKCKTMPIIGDDDPGLSLNRDDLDRLYADAGALTGDGPTTSGKALRRTRYTVNQHGEFGPTLTRADDSFRGPSKVALEDDPARAARMLDKTLPVLDGLEARATAGENVAEPLAYQRDLVARLRSIVGDAA